MKTYDNIRKEKLQNSYIVFFKSFASSSKNILECKIHVQNDKLAFVWGRNGIKRATIAIAPKTKCSWSVEFGILLRVPPTPARPSPTPKNVKNLNSCS